MLHIFIHIYIITYTYAFISINIMQHHNKILHDIF